MKRSYHGDWMDVLPSRFINEIPDHSVKNEIGLNEVDEFDFNQDGSIDFDEEYRSQDGIDIKKKKNTQMEKIKKRKANFKTRKNRWLHNSKKMNGLYILIIKMTNLYLSFQAHMVSL